MFLSEHWFEVVQIYTSIVPIPLFWVDVPMASEGIRLRSEASRAEVDGKVELEEVLQPMGLMMGQDLRAGEVLWVLVVSDHINQRGGALKVMLPVLEGLEDGQQLLVMGIIVQLRGGQSLQIISYQLEFGIGTDNGQDASDGIVQGVSLDHKQSIGNPMSEDRSRSEGLQEVESGATIIGEFPRSVFVGKPCERNDNVGVVMNETTVEVCESEEGLNVLNFLQFQPVRNGLNFLCRHRESVGRKTETEVLGGGGMELTLLWFGEEIVFVEASEDFMDMFLMELKVLGVY